MKGWDYRMQIWNSKNTSNAMNNFAEGVVGEGGAVKSSLFSWSWFIHAHGHINNSIQCRSFEMAWIYWTYCNSVMHFVCCAGEGPTADTIIRCIHQSHMTELQHSSFKKIHLLENIIHSWADLRCLGLISQLYLYHWANSISIRNIAYRITA